MSEHPYASFLSRVQKPGQYIGGEHGEVRKDWSTITGKMCLAFPDLYEVGMSHLGYKILYSVLNEHPKLLAERAYAPWSDMEKELRERNAPLRSLETWRPLRDFDVVGFSLQFELTYTNILTMLELGGIPLRAADRTNDDPLVIAGGPVATHAEPMAAFFDCFLIGDGEVRTPEIVLTWATLKAAGVSRHERLKVLATLEGVYVPSLYEVAVDADTGFQVVAPSEHAPFPVQRTFLERIDDVPFPSGGPVAATETIFDRVSIEIARGCTEGCRFCQAGMIYRPVRERDPNTIVDTILRAVKEGGYDEASLTSLSTADYSAISPLVRDVMGKLEKEKVALSVSSLRAYGLSSDILDEMQKSRATGLTFAPEAGTQRMRDVVNKNITEEQLMETAERVFSRGWSKMKLYFMIGLPTEQEEDVRGIVQTGQRALDVARKVQKGGNARVTVSVSTFVPKPHTPFQWCAMDSHATVVEKQSILKEEGRRSKVGLRMHDSEGSWLEGVLARGDRRLADVIERAYRNGARFDSWEEHLKLDVWREAFEHFSIDTKIFLGTIPVTARTPWDHIDVGLEEGFLAKEYRKALADKLSPPCGKVAGMFVHHTNVAEASSDARRLVCYDCGIACDLGEMKETRLVKLRSLGADEKREEVIQTRVTSPKERKPEFTKGQGQRIRVRFHYEKIGRIAFASHLDLVRLLPRMARRLGLPLYYTEGYHPKPAFSFGPALPLGISSIGEYLDLTLCADQLTMPLDGIHEALSRVANDGIRFVDSRVLGPIDPGLSRIVDEVSYTAGVPRHLLTFDAAARIEDKMQGELVTRRTVQGIGKRVDIKSYLLSVTPFEGGEALEKAGIAGDLVPFVIRAKVTGTGSARASEVLNAVLGEELPARFVRTGMFGTMNGVRATPLDLAVFRKHKTQRVEEERAPTLEVAGA